MPMSATTSAITATRAGPKRLGVCMAASLLVSGPRDLDLASVGLPYDLAASIGAPDLDALGREGAQRLRVRVAEAFAPPGRDDRELGVHRLEEGRRGRGAAAVVTDLEQIGAHGPGRPPEQPL